MNTDKDSKLPYTTKSGLRIGCRYERPVRADFTQEERFMQNLLLGQMEYSYRDKVMFILYCLAIVGIVFLLTALGVK